MRSKAAAQLAAAIVAGRLGAIAVACGVRENTVSQWATGRRTPSEAMRTALLAQGISDSWTEAAVTLDVQQVMAPREPPVEATARTTEQDALAMREQVIRMRDYIASLMGPDPASAIKLGEKVVAMLDSLGKLTGATEMNERKIVRTPAFERVWRLLCEAARETVKDDKLVAEIFRAWATKLEEIETT